MQKNNKGFLTLSLPELICSLVLIFGISVYGFYTLAKIENKSPNREAAAIKAVAKAKPTSRAAALLAIEKKLGTETKYLAPFEFIEKPEPRIVFLSTKK
jgi:hypothetical protein